MTTRHQLRPTCKNDNTPRRPSDLSGSYHPTERCQPLQAITQFHTPHPLRLHTHHVTDATTRKDILVISEDVGNKPSFFSGKRHVMITHRQTGTLVGTICTGSFSTSSIEITTTDGSILLSSASHTRRKWGFTPRKTTDSDQPWVWQRDKRRKGTVILTDAKRNGRTIARIAGDLLTFEGANLGCETIDDIVLTAVAMAVHVRRQQKHGDVYDVGAAIVGVDYSRASHGVESGGGGGGGGDGGGGCGGDGGGGCS